jgi:hypothetical protein
MFINGWRRWLKGSSPTETGARKARRLPLRQTRRSRPSLEYLEDRLAPATSITILASGMGSLDSALVANSGVITVNNGAGGGTQAETLSRGALMGLAATTDISITARTSILFNDLTSVGGTLPLATTNGHSVTFSTAVAGGGAITFANTGNTLLTSGASLDFMAGTNLTVANLNTGAGGDVSLNAGTNGAGNLSIQSVLTSGSGNLTFTASNGAGGTITQTGNASGLAVNVTAQGNITVDSLRGSTVTLTSNAGSVNSLAASPVQATGQLTATAATGITLNTLAAQLQANNSTSGDISITQAASPAQALTVVNGIVNSVAGGTINVANLGSSITVPVGVSVGSNNGAITLAGTDLQINGTVNSGTAVTTLANSVVGGTIDVGTNTAGKVGLTLSELNNVTAGALRIGNATDGSITISSAITPLTGTTVVALINNSTITEAAAGSLSLPNLRIGSTGPVSLTSVNNVQNLAGSVSGNGNAFAIVNGTNTLTIPLAGVDGVPGLTTNNGNITLEADNVLIRQKVTPGTATVILEPFTTTLNITVGTASVAGSTFGITNGGLGWITSGVTQVGTLADTGTIAITAAINRVPNPSQAIPQSRSQTLSLVTGNATANPLVSSTTGAITQMATLSVANLATQTVGGVQLTNAGNSIDTVAGSVTGTATLADLFHFVDAPAGALTVGTVAGVSGVSVAGQNRLELTTTGALTLANNLSGDIIGLNAGGAVTQGNGAGAAINTLTGSINHALELLGTGPYTLTNPNNSTGGIAANVTGAVSYTNAGALTVTSYTFGDNFGGTVSGVTTNGADINLTASAITGGTTLAVNFAINTTSTANITLSADRMSLGASVNAHAGVVWLYPTTGGRNIDLGTNANAANLGLLQTDLNNVTAGILRIGNLSTSGSITVTAAITDAGTGWSTLSLLTEIGSGISQNAGATLTVVNLNASGYSGVTLNQNNVVSTLSGASPVGAFNFTNLASLTVGNVDSGLGNGFGSGIITDAQPINLIVNVAGDSLTVNQKLDTTVFFGFPASGGADITLIADQMALNNNPPSSTINAGTNGALTLKPLTSSRTISIGGADSATQLGISDNDLSNVTANRVAVGSGGQTGALSIDAAMTRHSGYNTLQLLANGGGGAIVENGGSIDDPNLSLQANAGVGAAGAIQVVGPVNVVFIAGAAVQISATGALTIGPVLGLSATSGGATTLTASSPLTFAVNTTSVGTITATTTETASESATPLPPPDDDLTVNANVTVESTGGDVDFTSGDSIITGAGSLLKSDTGAVNLSIGVGDNDNDAVLSLQGTISAATVSITAAGDIALDSLNLGAASVTTVNITSTGGAIVDNTVPDSVGDADTVDVTATNLYLSAFNGIGTSSDPLETQVSNLAAFAAASGTGGIFISNGVTAPITLNISENPSATIQGVQVLFGPGDIVLTNNDTVNITTFPDIVSTDDLTVPGNITITAKGASADIVTAGNQAAVTIGGTSNSTVTLIAGRDLVLGTGGTSGNVNGGGSVVLRAGGNITVDEGTIVGAFGAGNGVTATAGGNISLLQTGGITGAAITASGPAPINLTTGAGGTFTLDSGAFGTVDSGGGDITISADRMTFNDPVNAGAAIVSLEPITFGRNIDVGTNSNPAHLGLLQSDLNNVTAGILRIRGAIGTTVFTGSITVTAPITDVGTGWTTLSLIAEPLGTITQGGGDTLAVTNLQAAGLGGVTLNENNAVSTLAGASTTTFSFVDTLSLAVDNVDNGLGLGFGIGIIGGGPVNVTLNTAGDTLTVNQPIDTTHFGGTGADVTLTADDMAINTTINGGSHIVILAPFSAGQPIDLGLGTTALGLSDTELGQITAGILRIGSSTAGSITLTGNVTTHAGYSTLSLITGGGIVEGAGSIAVSNLALLAATGIGSAGTLNTVVSSLAFQNLTSGAVQVSNTGALTIKAIDNLLTSFNQGTTTTLSAASPMTFAVNTTSAGTITATTTETGSEAGSPLPPPDDDLTVNSGVTVRSTGGDVTFNSGDSIVLQVGSVVQSDTGAVNLTIGIGDNDNDAVFVLNGTINAGTLNLTASGNIYLDASPLNMPGSTVTITSTGGGIFDNVLPEGFIDDTDVVAATLKLSASTGIGTSFDPLETQISNLEANTSTGGIFITNGVVSPVILNIVGNGFGPPDGVVVTGSGNIQLTNQGSINIVTTDDVVRSPDNITIQAVGATADIQTGGQGSFNAIRSTGLGDVSVTAGRDILMGDAVSFGSIVSANGNVTVNAGRNLIIDSDSRLAEDNASGTATGNVTATAGGNISVLQANGAGARIRNEGSGAISLTTGAGGVFTLDSGAGGSVTSTGGNITISADDMVINDPIDASNAGAATPGIVTLQPVSAGRVINLGTNGAGQLGLTDAELGQVTASILRIGNAANTGGIQVTAPITTHPGYSTLSLITGGGITQSGGAGIAVTNLAIRTVGGLTQTGPALNNVSTLAAQVTGAGAPFNFFNSGSLSVGTVDGVNGVSTNNGQLQIEVFGGLTITNTPNPNDIGSAGGFILLAANSITNNTGAVINSGGGPILVAGDNMNLQAGSTINSGAGTTQLRQFTNGTPINLGGADSLVPLILGLTNAEINTVTAGLLQIGDSNAGNITVSAAIAPAHVSTMKVQTGGSISDTTAGTTPSLTIANLALLSQSGIGGSTAAGLKTSVTNLSFQNSTSGAVAITNSGPLTLAGVAGVTSSSNNGTTTSVTARGGVTIAENVTGAGNVSISTGPVAVAGDNLTVNPGVTVKSTGGNVALTAGHNVTLPVGATLMAASAIVVNGGQDNGGSTVTLNGTVTAGGAATVNGGAGADSFNITPGATQFFVFGFAPTTFPGDTLNINPLTGILGLALHITAGPPSFNGSYTFSNRATVNFNNIEFLIPGVDLAVTKVAAPLHPIEGGNITYTISVTNKGPLAATGVTLTDVLPSGTAFVSASSNFSSYNPLTGLITIGSLAVNATVTGTIVVHPLGEGTVTNTVTAASSFPDINPADNTMTVVTQVVDNVGILLLEPIDRGALTLSGTGAINVTSGSILVNSTNPSAVLDSSSGNINAAEMDVGSSTGIVKTGTGSLPTVIERNEAPTADPLAALPQPTPPFGTPFRGTVNISTPGAFTLLPGIYGNISISGGASVTLAPGIYYINGSVAISGAARVMGNGVLLYLNPPPATASLSITGGAQVTLTAMTTGVYQGIAVWQTRSSGAPIVLDTNGMLTVTGSVYAAMGAITVRNGGTLSMKGDATNMLSARLIALDLVVSSGTVLVDATANPSSQP